MGGWREGRKKGRKRREGCVGEDEEEGKEERKKRKKGERIRVWFLRKGKEREGKESVAGS
jgi:hypothetical protein